MRIVCFFILPLIVACQNDKRPKEVLTPVQLSALLVEVYLAEARMDAIAQPKDTTIKYFIPFEQSLLNRMGVPDSVLRQTYTYYLDHPKELEVVYDSVIDTLTLREQRTHIAPATKPQ
ncbi:MAG TPA: DUF4296 domain-containing protein [Cyclobacteriaceae bacterium]|nr:DUF4296 domain-containing protein [Cyclobacteriaceae bacterium]